MSDSNNKVDDDHRLWHCTDGEKGHWCRFIYDKDALILLYEKLSSELSSVDGFKLDQPQDKTDLFQTALDDLLARRDRLTDALESGNLSADIYAERVKSIALRLEEVRKQIVSADSIKANAERQHKARWEFSEALSETRDFLTTADSQLVNTQLRVIIEKILVYEDQSIEIVFR
jgi:chromosome segregation ATPase